MSLESRRRSRTGAHPMNATGLAAALAARAEDVCRRYLPGGRRQGNYWTAGDTGGGPGRSLFVRLAPPGRSDLLPGKWTDAANGQHGDLLDLIRLHIGAASLRPAMDEARAFLALEPAPDPDPGPAAAAFGGPATSVATPRQGAPGGPGDYDREAAARRLWRRCRPSRAAMPKPTCTPAPSDTAGSRPCASIPICSIATTPASAACRRWSPPSPTPGRRHRRRPAHLARSRPARQGRPGAPAQGARARPRPRRALRRPALRRHAFRRRHRRDAAGRRGHRDRAVAGHRRARHRCRGGAVGRQPGRLRTAIGPRPADRRPRQRRRRRTRLPASRTPLRGPRHCLDRDRFRPRRFQRRPRRLRRRHPGGPDRAAGPGVASPIAAVPPAATPQTRRSGER